ncbi:MAG: glycosyltransferase [Deferrisomatales bacterium]
MASSGPPRLVCLVRSLSGGGMERMMLTLAGGFAARGYPTSLLVAVPRGALAARVPPGVELVALRRCSPWSARAALIRAGLGGLRAVLPLLAGPAPRMVARVPDLARFLREARPCAVLSAGTQSNLAALWARALAGSSVRVVVSERNALSAVRQGARRRFRRAYPALIGRLYPAADAVVAISKGVAEDLSSTSGLPRDRITVIYNPVVSAALQVKAREPVDHPWLAPGAPPVVLAAGRLHRQKDFPTLLRAFARVRPARPARLVILGEGEERARLERLARELGVAGEVALPGFVENPFAWMARADVFVLSSAWEGFGNVVVEALACGCPVVSTDCPYGPAEILDGGRYGPLVPVGDDEALARAILSVLAAPPDPERLRRRAARFAVAPAVERYLEVLLGGEG